MYAIQILLFSVLLLVAGAIVALLLNANSRIARFVSGIAGIAGSILGLAAAILAVGSGSPVAVLPVPLPFGQLILQMDGLSALMVGLISVIGMAASLYSISDLKQFDQRSLGVLGFFTNLFIASMLLVVTVANAFYFMMFWEMMTVASYFLVIFEIENKEHIRAGYLYMLVAHAGGILILLSFLVFFLNTGNFDFASFRQAQLSPGLRNLVFLLSFIGFGAKAGMVPLHIWMPSTYAAAPTHASALMASVMKKTAIYGILRICVDFLGASVLWWALIVLFFGAVSAVLGVLFALTEKDLKRMLAYSSVENVGIILLGIGAGMVGLAENIPVIALLGFLAALYHVINHSFFKGLLFLGAGSVSYQLQTRNLNQMGGLARKMPWTGLAFLTGALAVAAIPPFNGFVSEWFTYQSFFSASSSQIFIVRVIAPLCAALLALAGALAAMVFVKAYGGAFSGPFRSERASLAQESPGSMVVSMIFLALGCLALGIGAPVIAPYLAQVVAGFPSVSLLPVAQNVWVFPADPAQAVLSTPLVAILLLGLLVVPFGILAYFGANKAGRRFVDEPWACGYGYSSTMSVTASSFDQPMKLTFQRLYSIPALVKAPMDAIHAWSGRVRQTFTRSEPVIERVVSQPTARMVEYLGKHIQALQMGDIRLYCLYIILTLAILLIVIFR
jgi:hydrogenase-4 component B